MIDWSAVSVMIVGVTAIVSANAWVGKLIVAPIVVRLDQIDARLDKIDARLDRMDARFDRMDARLNKIEGHINDLRVARWR